MSEGYHEGYDEGYESGHADGMAVADGEHEREREREQEREQAKWQPSADLRERFAAHEHERWSNWMEYLFSMCIVLPTGEAVISKAARVQWMDQMKKPYSDLSDNEKWTDRDGADRILAIIAADSE